MRYALVDLCEITSRNVLFTNQTDEVITYLLNKADNPQVKKWINNNIVNKILKNDYKGKPITNINKLSENERKKADPKNSGWLSKVNNDNPIYKIDVTQSDRNKWEHWIDYLNTLEGNLNFGYKQIEDKVKKWEEKLFREKEKLTEEEKRKKAAFIEEDGIKIIHSYPNKFQWVKVFGENSLNREGKLMQHCVGTYFDKVKQNKSEIYSLRDNDNIPHCTIEFRPDYKEIVQIKGYMNKFVSSKYLSYVKDFIDKNYIQYKKVELSDSGLLNINNELYHINNIPPNVTIDGNLRLSNTHINKLPDNLEVKGDLYADYTNITKVPRGLKVRGDLNLVDSIFLVEVLDGVEVDGDLDLEGTRVEKIHKGLKVGGNLYLGYTLIEELPDDIEIGGSLDLSGANITKLPKELKVINGDLDLFHSNITELPDNLEVKGILNLGMTKITKLPKGLKVGKVLYLDKNLQIPDDAEIKKIKIVDSWEGLYL